jgi:ABC-2 type transport system ATP-binding protein
LQEPMTQLPAALSEWPLVLKGEGTELEYTFDAHEERTGIPALLKKMSEQGIGFRDLNTRQSSLEDIFVTLVSERGGAAQ